MESTFFSGDEADGEGVSVGLGVAVGLGDGVSSSGVADGEGDGVGDAVGVGESFFFFDFDFGLALGSGVGEAFLCFGDGEAEGVGLFFAAGCVRCFRAGEGVGVAKIFLIFSPNDSSAFIFCAPTPKPISKSRKTRNDVFKTGERQFKLRVLAERLCSCAFRPRDSLAESSR